MDKTLFLPVLDPQTALKFSREDRVGPWVFSGQVMPKKSVKLFRIFKWTAESLNSLCELTSAANLANIL